MAAYNIICGDWVGQIVRFGGLIFYTCTYGCFYCDVEYLFDKGKYIAANTYLGVNILMKQPWLFVTFATMSDALRMESLCHKFGIPGNLVPTPRHIASSCTTSWRSPAQYRMNVYDIMRRNNIRYQSAQEFMQ